MVIMYDDHDEDEDDYAGHDDDDAAQIELFQLRMATNVGDL